MVEIQDGRNSSDYTKNVWMPPLHTEHKESILCQIKGVPICPHTFGCPLYINNTNKACFVQLRGCTNIRFQVEKLRQDFAAAEGKI